MLRFGNSVKTESQNFASSFSTVTNVDPFSLWTIAQLTASAAAVSISGRVIAPNVSGSPKLIVTLTDMQGAVGLS
ncbi:MAG TPA: hypothetical protein VK308_17710 [Pyrinomonadaceae bacterium]|nr:hypothetical protein [Pyrinomonadaceae bacterium]